MRLEPGDKVRVPTGPFKDFRGEVVGVTSDSVWLLVDGEVVDVESDSVSLLIDVLGRTTRIEIPLSDFGDGGDSAGVREPRNHPPSAGTAAAVADEP